jgi:hypothetical protein
MATTQAYHKKVKIELAYGRGCEKHANCFECKEPDCTANDGSPRKHSVNSPRIESPVPMQTVVRKFNKELKKTKSTPETIITLGQWPDNGCKHLRTESTPIQKGGYVTETCVSCKAKRQMPGTISLINDMFKSGTLKMRNHGKNDNSSATIHIQKPVRGQLDHSGFKGR